MQRRSLLGLILASPLGMLIPRTTKASMLPGSQYAHFGEIMDEIADFASQSPKAEVLCADEPKQLLIGFAAFYLEGGNEAYQPWMVHITELRRLIKAMSDPLKRKLVGEAVCTQEGRLALARSIQDEGKKRHNSKPAEEIRSQE